MKRKREYSYKDVFIRVRRNKSQWNWEIISEENSLKTGVLATGEGCRSKNTAHMAAIEHYEVKLKDDMESK